jgi:hypothetical protein
MTAMAALDPRVHSYEFDEDVDAPAPSRKKMSDLKPRRATAEPPCVGCRHELRCNADKLGCDALVLYVRVTPSRERLAAAPRQPTRELFERAHAPNIRKPAPPVFRSQVNDDDAADVD